MDSSTRISMENEQTPNSTLKFTKLVSRIKPGQYFKVEDGRHRLLVRKDEKNSMLTLEKYFVGHDIKDSLDKKYSRDVHLKPKQVSFEQATIYLESLLRDQYRSMKRTDFSTYVFRSFGHSETLMVEHPYPVLYYEVDKQVTLPVNTSQTITNIYDQPSATVLLKENRDLLFQCLLENECNCGLWTLPPLVYEADDDFQEICCSNGKKLGLRSRQIITLYDEDHVQKNITFYNIFEDFKDPDSW